MPESQLIRMEQQRSDVIAATTLSETSSLAKDKRIVA
jgi:hypothetical protein